VVHVQHSPVGNNQTVICHRWRSYAEYHNRINSHRLWEVKMTGVNHDSGDGVSKLETLMILKV